LAAYLLSNTFINPGPSNNGATLRIFLRGLLKFGDSTCALALLVCVVALLASCSGGTDRTTTPTQTAPAITQQPASATVSAGQAATFTVAATGSAPLTYQWYLNGVASGTNGSSLSIASTTTSQTGATVSVKISNAIGEVTSSTATLTVNAATTATAPAITMQPTNQSVTAGQSATFSVTATGTAPLSYQWFLNGAASGTNASTYTITGASTSQTGAMVDVKISNAAGSVTSSNATLTVNAASSAPTITTQPANQTVTAGQTATFSVVASGTAPFTYAWFLNGAAAGTNSAMYAIANTTASQSGATIDVKVSNAAGSVTSSTVTLTVNQAVSSSGVNVLTYHNDVARTGQNLQESILTQANVAAATFGKLGFLNADGLVDAEPLYVSGVKMSNGTHNVVYVVTENDTAYAYDADTFAQLWKFSALGSGEVPSDDHGCFQVTPQIGITSTPVIDTSAGANGTMYLVALSKDSQGHYYHRLHALDLATGAELDGGPTTVNPTYAAKQGTDTFDPSLYNDRAALLLSGGTVYLSFTSHCDSGGYTGWVVGYDEKSLQQNRVANITPNGGDGAIWMSGDGPGADADGNIYFLAANGTFDDTLDSNGMPENGDYGNAFIKLTPSGSSLQATDYFTMYDTDAESQQDQDLGSGGELILPDQKDAQGNTWHLAVGAGKDGHIYVVNRDMMGKFNTNSDSGIYQEIDSNGLNGGLFATAAYFNGVLYFGAVGDALRAFPVTNAKLVTPATSVSADGYGYPGATPSVSANGTSNAIVWAVENNGGNGILHAYDAANLGHEFYNSNQAASGRDTFADNKFITPMIANGKVYVATPTGVMVFGLLGK
jgi:Immunoglobulin domain